MKKKRLLLSRETVLRLQTETLRNALGQGDTSSQLCDQATFCECATGNDCLPPTAVLGTCSHTDDWLCG